MSYFDEPKKHRKLLWDYLKFHKNGKIIKTVDKKFKPEETFEYLRWVLHKIIDTSPEGVDVKINNEIYPDFSCRITIQHWDKDKNHENIIKVKDKSEFRAVYNACVEYILKDYEQNIS